VKTTWRVHLAVLLGYILLSILITWPLALHITTALPGEGTDSWQYLWNFWWFDQALFHGQPLYFTTAQYYPTGTSLLFHTLSPLNSLIGLPARALGGYLAAYNLIVLLSTVLSGYGTFLLALEVLRPREPDPGAQAQESNSRVTHHASFLAAFVAGTVFALAPYRSVHLLGHLSLVSTETLPFFALFAWRTVRRPGWKPALGMALTWLAAMLIDWYYPLYMGLLAVFFLAWALGETLLKRRTWQEWSRAALTLAAAFLLATMVLSPLLVPMLRQSRQATYLEEPLSFSTTMGADLASFVLPGPLHPLWGPFFSRWTDPFADGNTAEGIVYVGLVALVLAVWGLWRSWRAGRMWAAVAGVFGLLAMGPYLKVLNYRTGIPLPYLLLSYLPIVRFTRVPSRYVVWVQLALAVLVGLGVMAIWEWRKRPRAGARHLRSGENSARHFRDGEDDRDEAGSEQPIAPGKRPGEMPRPYIVAAVVLALILVDYAVMPYPTTPAAIPPFYQELATDTARYALLELPLQKPASQWYYTRWMLYQTVHGKNSLRGYISRGDPLFNFGGAPFLRQLAGLGDRDIIYDDWRPFALALLGHYQIEYIVLERGRLIEEGDLAATERLVQEVLGPAGHDGRPDYDDGTLVAYRVPHEPSGAFLRLGDGWHEVEEQSWGPFRWINRDRAEVWAILPEEVTLQFDFQAVSFLRPRRLDILLNGTPATSFEVQTALQPYSVTLSLPAGENRLELRADGYDVPTEVGAGDDTRPVSIGFSEVRLREVH
jgi:hypothetical protein